MLKFRPIKRFLKKFKFILKLYYYPKFDFEIKTPVKSILSQSGILEANSAEDYLESIFLLFFTDLYELIKDESESENFTDSNNYILLNQIINKNSDNNIFKLIFTNLLYSCNAILRINFFLEQILNLNVINDLNNEKTADLNYEFKVEDKEFFFPITIYIYKKEFKNIFLVSNLLNSIIIYNLIKLDWSNFFSNRRKMYSTYFLSKYKKRIQLDSYLILLLTKFLKLHNFKFKKNYKIIFKFCSTAILTLNMFKFSLLKNFQYLYSFYFNYFNIIKIFSNLFGTILSFYNYFEFKDRKINFRRRIRKNMLLENKYI